MVSMCAYLATGWPTTQPLSPGSIRPSGILEPAAYRCGSMSELPMVCQREMEATMKIALPMTSAAVNTDPHPLDELRNPVGEVEVPF